MLIYIESYSDDIESLSKPKMILMNLNSELADLTLKSQRWTSY